MAEGKQVNWTGIILALLGLLVVSYVVYYFGLGGEGSTESMTNAIIEALRRRIGN